MQHVQHVERISARMVYLALHRRIHRPTQTKHRVLVEEVTSKLLDPSSISLTCAHLIQTPHPHLNLRRRRHPRPQMHLRLTTTQNRDRIIQVCVINQICHH